MTKVESTLEAAREALALDLRERSGSPEHARKILEPAALDLAGDLDALEDEHAQDLLWRIGELAYDLGSYDVARATFGALIELRERTLGADHRLVQAARSMLALALKEQGDLRRAREVEEDVLAAFERVPPADENQLHMARMSLAATLGMAGDYVGARSLIETTLARWEETLPERDPNLLRGRQYLVNVLLHTGQFRAAHALAEELLPRSDEELARANSFLMLYTVADARTGVGDLDGAYELRERMLAEAERTLPRDHPWRLMAENAFAISLRERGQLDQAEELLESVLAERLQTLPEDSFAIQKSRLALSSTLLLRGDLRRARELAEQTLRSFERSLPPGHLDIAHTRPYLAQILRMQGDLVAARRMVEMGLAVLEAAMPENHLLVQDAQTVLASLMLEMGDLQGARALQERVLAAQEVSWSEDHPTLQVSRQELAATLCVQGEFAAARALMERALASRQRRLPATHSEIAGLRLNLAIFHVRVGELARARELLEALEAQPEPRLPPEHPQRLMVQNCLAFVLLLQGEPERARELQAQAIAVIEGIHTPSDPTLQRARRTMVRILDALGDEAAFLIELERLADGLEARIPVALSLAPREALEAARSANEDLDLLISSSLELPEKAAFRRRILALSERLRAVSLAPVVPTGLRSRDPEAMRHAARVLERRQAVDALVARMSMPDQLVRPGASELADAVRARDLAGSELRHALGVGRSAVHELDVKKIAAALPHDGVALSWRRFDRSSLQRTETGFAVREEQRLLGAVVRADATAVMIDLGPVAELEAEVARWRGAVGEPTGRGVAILARSEGDAREEVELGKALRRRVLDPLLAESGAAQVLVVCPEEALHLVPLDALPVEPSERGARGTLLGERFELRCEPSFARMLEPHRASAAEPVLLAVGGVDFDARADGAAAPSAPPLLLTRAGAGPNFTSLPGSQKEIEQVAREFQDSTGRDALVLLGAAATKQTLVEHVREATYLHLATHGWFSGSPADAAPAPTRSAEWSALANETLVQDLAPLTLCGLALAGANRGADERGAALGLITAEEFAGLDLANCELAVLSACETNVGITRAGQGIQSLQAALHAAGARSVITSLWRVPDEETRILMADFYRRLWSEGASKGRALIEAKLARRAAGRPTREWAGWVLSGDPE